jgi:hypothetical protein
MRQKIKTSSLQIPNFMKQSPWEADGHSAGQKILCLFMEPTNFITVFTRAFHWSLSWTRWIQSTPWHSVSLRSTILLSFYLCLNLWSCLFPSGFLTKILWAYLFSLMHATSKTYIFIQQNILCPRRVNKSYTMCLCLGCNLCIKNSHTVKSKMLHGSFTVYIKHCLDSLYK